MHATACAVRARAYPPNGLACVRLLPCAIRCGLLACLVHVRCCRPGLTLTLNSLLAHAASSSCLSNRILWRGRGLRLRQYDACMSIRGSDHKPVVALFDLDVKQALAPDALRRVSSPSVH